MSRADHLADGAKCIPFTTPGPSRFRYATTFPRERGNKMSGLATIETKVVSSMLSLSTSMGVGELVVGTWLGTYGGVEIERKKAKKKTKAKRPYCPSICSS